jgi:hypothetical protein
MVKMEDGGKTGDSTKIWAKRHCKKDVADKLFLT